MLTKGRRILVGPIFSSDKRLSLRLRDAPMGVAALGSIVAGVLTLRFAEMFETQRLPLSQALSIVVFFFAPALLGAIYSLFFEESKIYGMIDLVLAGIVLRMLPFTGYWIGLYFPYACALAAFCAVVRLLEHARKR